MIDISPKMASGMASLEPTPIQKKTAERTIGVALLARGEARGWPRSNNSGVVSISHMAGLKLERGWQIRIGCYRGHDQRFKLYVHGFSPMPFRKPGLCSKFWTGPVGARINARLLHCHGLDMLIIGPSLDGFQDTVLEQGCHPLLHGNLE